ncbi:MAG: hypothetical protein J2P30_20770, partial [Actinobacteria bacterium]|nr:hypothetical protein [Actinomycetota bacterium]
HSPKAVLTGAVIAFAEMVRVREGGRRGYFWGLGPAWAVRVAVIGLRGWRREARMGGGLPVTPAFLWE